MVCKWERELEELWGYQAQLLFEGKTPESGLGRAVMDKRWQQWFQPFGLGFLSLQVKVPMKFNGSSGVQVRMPSNLQDLAAYTSLKFYIQNPEPRSQQQRQDGAEEGRFVLYLGSREVRWDCTGRRGAAGAQTGSSVSGEFCLGIMPSVQPSAPGEPGAFLPMPCCSPSSGASGGAPLGAPLCILIANTWPCLSPHSGHWRLPGYRAQGPQSAVGLQTG